MKIYKGINIAEHAHIIKGQQVSQQENEKEDEGGDIVSKTEYNDALMCKETETEELNEQRNIKNNAGKQQAAVHIDWLMNRRGESKNIRLMQE